LQQEGAHTNASIVIMILWGWAIVIDRQGIY